MKFHIGAKLLILIWRATLYTFRTFLASEAQVPIDSNRASSLPLNDFCTTTELQSGVGVHPGHVSNTQGGPPH